MPSLKTNYDSYTLNSNNDSVVPVMAKQGRSSKRRPLRTVAVPSPSVGPLSKGRKRPAAMLPTPLGAGDRGTMPDPIATVDRYEKVTGLIEKRLADYTQDFDRSQTVRQWLSGIYADQDLIAWDRERRNLEGFLPLGYAGDRS